MEKQTLERDKLHDWVPPTGNLIPIIVETMPINNKWPGDLEIRVVVKAPKSDRASSTRGGENQEYTSVATNGEYEREG